MRCSKLAFVPLLALAATQAAQAQNVVTFDDLSGSFGSIPLTYSGITWDTGTNWLYFQPAAFNQSALYQPHSGTTVGYSHSTDSLFTFATPKVFVGAWFSGSSSEFFTLKDANNNVLFTSSTLALTPTPQFLSSGYSGLVSIVDVHSSPADTWEMDDVTYRSAAVPEPGSVALLATSALTGAGFLMRRRKYAGK